MFASFHLRLFILGLVFDLQNYVKYKYALDEADKRGWFPLHEAAVQPIQQILEVILDGKLAQTLKLQSIRLKNTELCPVSVHPGC